MKAKGTIREVLVWERARAFFYWRLRRRLAEDAVRRRFKAASPELSRDHVTEALRRLMASNVGAAAQWEDDQAVALWLEDAAGGVAKLVDAEARAQRVAHVARELRELDPVAARQAVREAGY
jgi:acetyl-CoA carboxylase/biotin carboxylase 1